jgi:hypothetical protein
MRNMLLVSPKDADETVQQMGNGSHAGYGMTQISLRLQGVIGVPDKNPHVPETLSFSFSPFGSPAYTPSLEKFSWPFEQAMHERGPIRFAVPLEVAKSFEQRSWGDPTLHAIIMPLSSDGDSKPLGFLITGLNTRRNYDADYSNWVNLLKSALSSYLTGSIAREEEVKRAK